MVLLEMGTIALVDPIAWGGGSQAFTLGRILKVHLSEFGLKEFFDDEEAVTHVFMADLHHQGHRDQSLSVGGHDVPLDGIEHTHPVEDGRECDRNWFRQGWQYLSNLVKRIVRGTVIPIQYPEIDHVLVIQWIIPEAFHLKTGHST